MWLGCWCRCAPFPSPSSLPPSPPPPPVSVRVAEGRILIQNEYSMGTFGNAWVSLIQELADRDKVPEDELRRLTSLVAACPDRGQVLGVVSSGKISSGSCCGGGETRHQCLAGKGLSPGLPTLDECLTCRAELELAS